MSSSTQPPYQVRLRNRRVQRELEAIPRSDRNRVEAAIQALASEPRPSGAVQLESGIFRIRVGNYRVIYHVNNQERLADIGGIRRRNEGTYRRIGDLF